MKKKKPKKDDMNPLVWAFVCYALSPEEERESFLNRLFGRCEYNRNVISEKAERELYWDRFLFCFEFDGGIVDEKEEAKKRNT